MGVFSDWAQNYYDCGLSVLPVHPEKKACFVKGWTEIFSKKFPTPKEQDYYIDKYKDYDLGLACGESSKIIAIDFDYVNMGDSDWIESLVIGALPKTQCIKKGSKGWTRFYRFDGDIQNASIDRMGARMIDVLSTGRLTVLPPSSHKEGMLYKWVGSVDLCDSDDEDMDVFKRSHLDQLFEIANYGQDMAKEFVKKKARHDAIVGFILRYSDEAKDMEDLVQACFQADIRFHKEDPKGPYLTDKKYLKGLSSYEFTKNLCERVVAWKIKKRSDQGLAWDLGKYPKLHSEGKKQSTNYDDFKTFFEFHYPKVRFDKIRRTTYYFCERSKNWEPIDNIREVIESHASDAGLSPSYVNRHLQRWTGDLKPRLCIDIPRWKGQDVVAEMVSRLDVKNIDQDLVVELFKEWGGNIFRRLYDVNKREQNKMIILKGGQGIGKDSWINYMFGSLGNYFSEIELQDRKIENYQTISDLLVANIPEFDETHRVSLSTLKSLITSPGATFRAAYARKSDYVPFYVSYISSCNFDHILRDSSGNRRFMIFEVDQIKWGYDDVPQDQLLAQFYHLYSTDYKASKTAHDAMKNYIAQNTPEDIDDLIADECCQVIKQAILQKSIFDREVQKKSAGYEYVFWPDISDEVTKISARYRVGLRRVQSVIKNNNMQKRVNDQRRYVSTVMRKVCGHQKDE